MTELGVQSLRANGVAHHASLVAPPPRPTSKQESLSSMCKIPRRLLQCSSLAARCNLEDGLEAPVIVVQPEVASHGIILGVRPLSGGNGIYMSSEVRLLPDGF